MSIIHCLFWIKDGTVRSLMYEDRGLRIIRFAGRDSVPLTDGFWDEWIGYSGMCMDDRTDFCFIYDEKPAVRDGLLSRQCGSGDCIWSRKKIEEAARILEITDACEIRDEQGRLMAKAGCFTNVRKNKIVSMSAWYMKPDSEPETSDDRPGEKTTLIEYYEEELEKYKEGYDRNVRGL